jgi:hypothetical protein
LREIRNTRAALGAPVCHGIMTAEILPGWRNW